MDLRTHPEAVSKRMRRQKSRETSLELAVRRELYAMGCRYRVQYPVPGIPRRSIDIAFPGARLAIFLDGCFWHGCPDHGSIPGRNGAWWREKLESNRKRDEGTAAHLTERGWRVMRFWEHETLGEIVDGVANALARRPPATHAGRAGCPW